MLISKPELLFWDTEFNYMSAKNLSRWPRQIQWKGTKSKHRRTQALPVRKKLLYALLCAAAVELVHWSEFLTLFTTTWNKDGRKLYFLLFFFFRKTLWFISASRSKHIKFKKSNYITVLPAVVLSQCIQIFSGSYHNVSEVLTASYKRNVWSIPSSLKQIAVCIKKKSQI